MMRKKNSKVLTRSRGVWRIHGILLVTVALALEARAQVPVLSPEDLKKALGQNPQEPVTAITGGTVLPVQGPMLRRGTVILRGSKIEAIGVELPIPKGATVVDATLKYVTPGFVAVEAAGIGVATTDGNISDSLDPYQLSLRVALASGITTVNLIDTAFFGFFGGEEEASSGATSAIIKLTYGDLGSMLLREPGLNYFAVPTRQVELNLFRMRENFRKAEAHLKAVKDAEAKKAPPPKAPSELGQYVTILENQRPTVVSAQSPEQIRDILALRDQFRFDLVLSRPEGGYSLAPEIAAREIPVLLKARGPDFNFDLTRPVLSEEGLIPIRLPAAFSDRGVRVTLLPYRRGVSLDGLAGRDITALPFEAAFTVRGGLDEERALECITLNPARVLRIADRVGSLEKGKDADVLILSRHPLDYRSCVEKAYINGKLYYDRSKSLLYKGIPLK